jgi:aldose 1-epimerase
MFQTEIHKQAGKESVRITQNGQLRLEVLAGHGSALSYFSTRNREDELVPVISGYGNATSPDPEEDPYRGVVLFPFPNRLRDGQFHFQGKDYQFPINEPARNHALHGNLFAQPFEILNGSQSMEMASLRLAYTNEGKETFFPFPYRLEIEFLLTDRDGLHVHTQLINTGQSDLPFGLGWHPYFGTTSPIDTWIIQFPEAFLLELDKRMIPTGQELKYRTFEAPQPFGTTVFDTGFRIPETIEIFKIQILDPEKQLKFTYWQQADPEGYRYVQLYTPPGRKCLALEPMSCPANGFQTHNFHVLEPGATQIFSWGIS